MRLLGGQAALRVCTAYVIRRQQGATLYVDSGSPSNMERRPARLTDLPHKDDSDKYNIISESHPGTLSTATHSW